MKFEFSKIAFILSILYQIQSQCSTRKEWRQLSSSQQESYLSAVIALKAKAKGPDSDFLQWNHDQFAQVHAQYYNNNHEKAPFFPWHRKFINSYELALQRIDSSVFLPYWDWGMDSNHPGAADLFTERAFGGAGDPSNDYCALTGVAAGWKTHLGSCLKRCSAWGK
jgi:tyrosinase